MKRKFYSYWGKTALFWLLFFAIHRIIFIAFNHSYIHDTSFVNLAKSFFYGGRLDLSIVGYLMVMIVLGQIGALIIGRRYSIKFITYFTYAMVIILSSLLLSDTYLFSFWGKHLDGEGFSYIQTPDIILRSLKWYQSLGYLVAWSSVSAFFIWLFNHFVKGYLKSNHQKLSWKQVVLHVPLVLFIGAFMILPIRGGVGVAPINTGVAFFSPQRFANQSAINPIWNLMYSLKKLDATKQHYSWMDDNQAHEIVNNLMKESGQYPKVLNTERPNVVVILMESFAAHVIEPLGGHAVTPNFTKLCNEGLLFTNMYAASTRSDKGIVATMAGYPVLPSYSIIRYPDKTESLSFLPKKFKEAGYKDIMYMYGGDMGFKNMRSFVNQAGFNRTIDMTDFPSEFRGEKWGVHDEYTFDRLADEMKNAQKPFFYFYFTLSSHEPFDVPMQRVYEDDYHNSVNYTDKCLGDFIQKIKDNGQWDNTLIVLIADHGVPGPEKYTADMKQRNHIPMLWTGGAVAEKGKTVDKIGSQTDLARTLLNQVDIDDSGFTFSKNILDEGVKSFAFFDYPDAMGIVEDSLYQVYDNQIKRFLHMENARNHIDSIKAKAYLQVLSLDHRSR